MVIPFLPREKIMACLISSRICLTFLQIFSIWSWAEVKVSKRLLPCFVLIFFLKKPENIGIKLLNQNNQDAHFSLFSFTRGGRETALSSFKTVLKDLRDHPSSSSPEKSRHFSFSCSLPPWSSEEKGTPTNLLFKGNLPWIWENPC